MSANAESTAIESKVIDVKAYMSEVGRAARSASRDIGRASTAQKNQALEAIASHICVQAEELKKANALDLVAGREKGLDAALLDH